MDNKEYFEQVGRHFNLDEELKATVLTAQSFIEMGLFNEKEALLHFKITKQQYDQYKELPKS